MAARAQVMVQGGGWRHSHWQHECSFFIKKNGLVMKAQTKQWFPKFSHEF
jgi:hypothetical protein